ncbi:hypothetical protein H5410_052978 [Solanum commersonii]|uniref:Uncharacterized protein n=1 Tax=Solanum commersonii TaxID=4109 RepID=A0A9J5X3P2_SOLCO|nr:hypothetical protein H5410_052978 [Solanum commersonii]
MEPIGYDEQNNSNSRSNYPRRRFPPILLIFVCYSSPSLLVIRNFDVIFAKNFMDYTIFFGNPEFQRQFCRNLSWTSVKTLTMEEVGPYGQNNLFSRSYDPWSRIPLSYLQKKINGRPLRHLICSQLALMKQTTHFQGSIFKFKRAPEQTSVKTLAMEPIDPDGQNDPFSRILTSFLLQFIIDVRQDLSY